MLAAANNPAPQVITVLLEAGAGLDDTVNEGRKDMAPTAVDFACQNPNAEVFFTLVKAGAKVKSSLIKGVPSYFYAVSNREAIRIFDYLQKQGVDLRLPDRDGKTVLMWAAEKSNNPALISYLLEAGIDIDIEDKRGATALSWAVFANPEVKIIETLLKAGAKVNLTGKRFLPFPLSAYHSDVKVMNMLLDAGAKPTQDDLQDALLQATGNSNLAIIKRVVELGGDISKGFPPRDSNLLFRAAAYNTNPEMIKYLIAAGCNVNDERDGWPVYMSALANNPNPEIFQLLLENGAEFHPGLTFSGYTALHCAAQNRDIQPEQLEFLLKNGEDVNARDPEGRTALHYIISSKNLENIRLLLDAGSELEVKGGSDGETPLILAARTNRNPTVLSMLLKAGANVNATNSLGETALMGTAWKGTPESMQLLLEAGADINARSSIGRNVLLNACGMNTPENVQFLLEAGADGQIRTTFGSTVYREASTNPNLVGTELLETLKKLSPPPLPERKPDLKDFDYVEPYTPPPPREPSDFDSMDWAVRWAAYGKVISLIIGILCLAIVIFLKVRAAVAKRNAAGVTHSCSIKTKKKPAAKPKER